MVRSQYLGHARHVLGSRFHQVQQRNLDWKVESKGEQQSLDQVGRGMS
jgi:hypothetical protein